MTTQADIVRTRRKEIARPGSPLDRIVRALAIGLPALVGAVAAMMLITPLSPRGEVSFLLDRNKVATANDRLKIDNAMYRGEDSKGRPFSLSAGKAVQRQETVPIVNLHDVVARLLLPEGPAVLSALSGEYNIKTEKVSIPGVVQFNAADGYSMAARNVLVDLPARTLVSDGRVEGTVPAGSFYANSMRADLADRTLALIGDAHLTMTPGKMQMPKAMQ